MKLYLSSYRVGKNISFLRKWISENDNKIVVIPNALDEIEDSNEKNSVIMDRCSDLGKLGFEIEILDLEKYFDKKDELKEYLKDKKSFYVLGGNVFILNRAMKLSGFDNYLLDKIDDDSILYSGFSAGICVLAQNLSGLDLVVNPNFDSYNSGIVTMKGIGILDYLPVPHYKSNHPASKVIDEVIKYLDKKNLNYRTLCDGDVIIESTAKNINIKKYKN